MSFSAWLERELKGKGRSFGGVDRFRDTPIRCAVSKKRKLTSRGQPCGSHKKRVQSPMGSFRMLHAFCWNPFDRPVSA